MHVNWNSENIMPDKDVAFLKLAATLDVAPKKDQLERNRLRVIVCSNCQGTNITRNRRIVKKRWDRHEKL